MSFLVSTDFLEFQLLLLRLKSARFSSYILLQKRLMEIVATQKNFTYSNMTVNPTLGKLSVGKENSNSYRLLQFCVYNNLVIISSLFGHKMFNKLTW